jgi:hypothetical protein
MKRTAAAVVCLFTASVSVSAWDKAVGTWILRTPGKAPGRVMKIESWGPSGSRISSWLPGPPKVDVGVLETKLDGADAPLVVQGKPSGMTMAIKQVDSRRVVSVLKLHGKPYGTSKGEVSSDGKVLRVENEITDTIGGQPGKSTEVWDRQ